MVLKMLDSILFEIDYINDEIIAKCDDLNLELGADNWLSLLDSIIHNLEIHSSKAYSYELLFKESAIEKLHDDLIFINSTNY